MINRFASIAIVIMILLAVTMIYVAMQPPLSQPPAIEWVQDSYQPVSGCPGDEVRYSLHLRVNEPAVLYVATAELRPGPNGDTIRGRELGDIFITVIPSPREIVDEDVRWTIPSLPPGDYVRMVAAGKFGESSDPAMREQPFSVVEGCD